MKTEQDIKEQLLELENIFKSMTKAYLSLGKIVSKITNRIIEDSRNNPSSLDKLKKNLLDKEIK